jgi:cytochrome P450
MADLTLETIGQAGFGHKFHSFDEGNDPDSFKSRVAFLMPRVHMYCLVPKWIRDRIPFSWIAKVHRDVEFFKREIRKIIDARRELIEQNKNTSKDLLSLLISGAKAPGEDEHKPLSDRELGSNVFIFLLAGAETTANSITFILYWLCRYPEIQEKARQEIEQVLGGKDPSYEDLDKLVYLNNIIKETLRITPVVPMTSRTTKVPVKYKNYTIPEDSVVIIQLTSYHFDEQYFEDAHTFKPERWEDLEFKNSYCYNPVSAHGSTNRIVWFWATILYWQTICYG